jgi:hypothetical protein
MLKRLISLVMTVLVPLTVFAADDGYSKVKYTGGTLPVKADEEVKLFLQDDQIRVQYKKEDPISIPAKGITEVSYGQEVHRRIGAAAATAVFTLGIGAILLLSKSKKHYIGVLWDDAASGKKGGFVIQADKNQYRGLLAGLEGISGKKAIDADAEAAKARDTK